MLKQVAILCLFLIMPMLAASANAQQSLSEIKEKLGQRASELEEVDQMLANPDKNQRIAAMELLLASGNPVFVNRAKEAGLFSSDPEMRNAALKAIFDSGGPFRIVFDFSGKSDEDHGIKDWSGDVIWNPDTKLGRLVFTVQPYNKEKQCWESSGRNCAIYLTGTTVSLRDWRYASGSLELDNSGRLVGTFRATGSSANVPVTAYIPLME